MKYYILLMTFILFNGCNNRNIKSLKQEKVKFTDLPVEISEYIKKPSDVQSDMQTMLLELPKGFKSNYKLETIKTFIGPWVSHVKLINIEKNISYKIDQGVPCPYIVYENKLYVPDRYNILTTTRDLNSLEFIRYDLE